MKTKILFCLLAMSAILAKAQTKTCTVSGYVQDARTGEQMIGANVYAPALKAGTASNTYGFFSLTLPATDTLVIAVSYIGYTTRYFKLPFAADVVQNFALSDAVELQAVEITATKNGEKIEERTAMSVREIPIQQIKQIPALLGEVDVLKALQLLPGVQSGGEGGSGLYVRGGSPDQNLILLDGVPVYNVSHLFGFFSVFNADAIKNVTLTTGGFPSRYGGRLSSVLEINMKEGNLNEWHGEGSVGIIASRLTVEGPLKKGTTSVMLSGRRTYIDALAAPIVALQTQGNSAATLYFYDLNGKINHKFSEKDRLYASAYLGQDNFGFSNKTSYLNNSSTFSGGLNWGNATAALRWNHIWNKKLFSNTTATYSYYQLNTPVSSSSTTNGNTSGFEVRYFSGITDWAGKIDFDYVPNPQHYIRFGVGGIYHTFKPGATNVKLTGTGSPGLDTTFGTQNIRSGEYALYAEDDYSVTKDFKANVGLHVSAFAVQNQSYYSAQPRVGLRYLLPNRVALKASFATMTQYVHLLTNEGIGLPTDLWVPTTAKVKPEQSWQAAFGAATTVAKDYELTAEVYYKGMQNVVSYQEGASFFGNTDWESKVTQGKGTAYGLELMFQKKAGNTTGWIGYTLAWSTRQFADINFGKAFPYKYDRRHDIEIVVIHKFNDRISLSGTWVYGTGNAVSLPLAKYASLVEYNQYGQQSAGTVSYYGEKNSFRLPAYHRLDISVEFHKKFKHWERTWTIGAYNAYSNPNVFFVYQGNNETTFAPEFKQVSLFPIVPSVSYNFKF